VNGVFDHGRIDKEMRTVVRKCSVTAQQQQLAGDFVRKPDPDFGKFMRWSVLCDSGIKRVDVGLGKPTEGRFAVFGVSNFELGTTRKTEGVGYGSRCG
jgi:hypothetical protein